MMHSFAFSGTGVNFTAVRPDAVRRGGGGGGRRGVSVSYRRRVNHPAVCVLVHSGPPPSGPVAGQHVPQHAMDRM